jgi:hypothetical protein
LPRSLSRQSSKIQFVARATSKRSRLTATSRQARYTSQRVLSDALKALPHKIGKKRVARDRCCKAHIYSGSYNDHSLEFFWGTVQHGKPVTKFCSTLAFYSPAFSIVQIPLLVQYDGSNMQPSYMIRSIRLVQGGWEIMVVYFDTFRYRSGSVFFYSKGDGFVRDTSARTFLYFLYSISSFSNWRIPP